MLLQGSLRIVFKGEPYFLIVKTFLKNNVYYFYITDKEKNNHLLEGKTLELTYADNFCATDREEEVPAGDIPEEIVTAIQSMLLENKQLWFY